MHPQRLFLLFSFLLCWTLLRAETRHIHVIQMLDDNSPNYLIREGCRSIDYGIQREVDRIQQGLGISNVHYYRLSGLSFNRESLEFVLDYQLAYQERDIILFVYTGHGYRDIGSTHRLPKLYFTGYNSALEGDDLRLRLIEKNPSLLINLVIACNTVQRDHRVAPGQPRDEGPTNNRLSARPRVPRPYEVLFSDQPGYTKVIDLVSSDREYETYLSRDGGIFFGEVLYAFEEVFVDEHLRSWPEVCQYISKQTALRTRERNLPQKPYCAYNVFQSIPEAAVVVGTPTAIPAALSCTQAARALRRDQRRELKALRRRHRKESRALAGQEARRLASSRHKQEVAQMKYVHLQDYQRTRGSCR